MPTIRTPDGRRLRVPDGATPDQINSVLQSQGYDIGATQTDFGNVQSGSGTTERMRPSANDSDFARLVSGSPKQRGNAISRAAGDLGAREVLQGAYGLYGALGGDALNEYVLNPIDKAVGWGDQLGVGDRTYRQAVSDLADDLGMRKPETPTQRVVADIGEGLTGTALTMGLGGVLANAPNAGNITGRVGKFLTAQPGLQAVSTATGTGAASTARESGAGQGAQLAAGLIGGLAPGATAATGGATVRGLVRGRSGENMQRTIDDFASVGATPSAGQASGNRFIQGSENLLGGAPTSAGVVNRFAERQAQNIGVGLQKKADEFLPNASGEKAGRAVERGVRGADDQAGFVQNSRKVADDLYRRVDDTIPKGSRVDVQSTRAALADLNSMIDGAPSVSRFFQNARLEGIERGLLSDVGGADAVLTQPGMRENVEAYRKYLQGQAQQIAARNAERQSLGMNVLEPVPTADEIEENVRKTLGNMVDQRLPYEALQKLRTLVGNEIEGATLTSDVPRSKWKALYGALSRDMEAAATTPEAKQALSRANAYYNARISRLDAIDSVVNKHGGPEKIFEAAMSGTRDGGTTLRAVMQSLPQDGQRAVTAAVIKRMGMATPGAQDAAGEVFSAQTFLTNWNRISPEAKRALFDRHGPDFSRDMDRIARVAQNIREGSRVLANPSGTANRAAALTYGASLVASLFDPSFLSTGGLVGSGIGANWLARKLTDPDFVRRLANTTAMPIGSVTAQAQILRSIGEKEEDPETIAVADALAANPAN